MLGKGKVDCSDISKALLNGKSSVEDLITISGLTGYYLSVKVDKSAEAKSEDSYSLTLIQNSVKGVSSGNYAFEEGHRVLGVSNRALEKSCQNWKLDPKSNLAVLNSVSNFINGEINEFKLKRALANYHSLADLPSEDWYSFEDVFSLFGNVIIVPELLDGEKADLDWEKISIDDYPLIFGDVGVEYFTNKKNDKVYIAIYKDVNDKANGIPPKYFIVYKFDKKRVSGKIVMFIHNYNEDTKKFYLSAK